MVHHMVGYDVFYERKAFRTKSEPDGLRADKLASLIRGAARGVLSSSGGRWIITPKNGRFTHRADTIGLTVTVPAGVDQSKQMIAAVKELERRIENQSLALPVDTTLRTIEGNGPGCEVCGKRSDWFRHTLLTRNHHFCDEHARAEADFSEDGFSNPRWLREEPAIA